jgi:hypothetical protein
MPYYLPGRTVAAYKKVACASHWPDQDVIHKHCHLNELAEVIALCIWNTKHHKYMSLLVFVYVFLVCWVMLLLAVTIVLNNRMINEDCIV